MSTLGQSIWVVHGAVHGLVVSVLSTTDILVHSSLLLTKLPECYIKNYPPYLNHVCPANKKGDVIFPTQTAAIKFRSISAKNKKIIFTDKLLIAAFSHKRHLCKQKNKVFSFKEQQLGPLIYHYYLKRIIRFRETAHLPLPQGGVGGQH